MSTAPPRQVLDWLNKNYPRPRIDPQWLDECYGWLVNDQGLSATGARLPELLNALESQLLQSSLRDSMLPGTGLPTRISLNSNPPTKLTGPPVLVEITSITEIASSAHSLNQTRIARMERMSNGATEEGDGDEEVEGEGPIPKYSRGMLRLELTDGTTTLKAIEYRSIPELTLGITPLGYKMSIKDVPIKRGIAFLEPKCIIHKGHQTEEREKSQLEDFAAHLRQRLGQPEPVPDLPGRSPLRVISRPPSPVLVPSNDDTNEPRRRRVPSTQVSTQSSTSRHFHSQNSDGIPGAGPSRVIRPMPRTASNPPVIDLVLSPRRATIGYSERLSPEREDFNSDDYFDYDDIPQGVKEHQSNGSGSTSNAGRFGAPASGTKQETGEKLDQNIGSPGFDEDYMDDDLWRCLDEAEEMALPGARTPVPEVITIDDDDDSEGNDKENMPAPTRHVRQRTVDIIDISD